MPKHISILQDAILKSKTLEELKENLYLINKSSECLTDRRYLIDMYNIQRKKLLTEATPESPPKLNLKTIGLKLFGIKDKKYGQRRMTEEQEHRKDIDINKLYLVKYNGIWLIGRFQPVWYGWNFSPNMGAMTIQLDMLDAIYELQGLEQNEGGSTTEFILEYLKEDN